MEADNSRFTFYQSSAGEATQSQQQPEEETKKSKVKKTKKAKRVPKNTYYTRHTEKPATNEELKDGFLQQSSS